MEQLPGRTVSTRRVWTLGLLAVGAFVTRLPWDVLAPVVDELSAGELSVHWILTRQSLVNGVGLALEFGLVWAVVFVALPALYPRQARTLTTTLPFRTGVAGLTTACAVVVFAATTRQPSPAAFVAVVASTVLVTVVTTSRTNNWQFSTPHVSPAFAVLVSFIPTSRLTEFAGLYRTGTVDPRTRVGYQTLFGVVTAGFVLVVGVLTALPILVFPASELLVFAGLAALVSRRLLPVFPTNWRLRHTRTTRRVRRWGWVARRVLASFRGTTATLLVTAGFVLAVSVVVLAVAVAASAARRTALGALSFSSSGALAEWVAVVSLLGYALTVGWFWVRMARWLPSFVAAHERPSRVTDGASTHAVRPRGTLLPQSCTLVAALLVFTPATVLGAHPLWLLVVLVVFTGWSLATPWLPRDRVPWSPTVQPRVPDTVALPASFTVQWLGISVALVLLPETTLASVGPPAVLVLVGFVGSYAVGSLRDSGARSESVDVELLSLAVFTVVAVLFVWAITGPIRSVLFG